MSARSRTGRQASAAASSTQVPAWAPDTALGATAAAHARQPGDGQVTAPPLDAGCWPAPWRDETVRVTEACTACGACLVTCPERALRRAPKRPLVVDAACTACWACIEICPAGAIVAVPAAPTGLTRATA